MSNKQPETRQEQASRINRRATADEQAKHDKEFPQILRDICLSHRKTQAKVRKMTNSILLNDRG